MCLITQNGAPTGRFVVEMFVLDLWCFVAMSFEINVSYNAICRPNRAFRCGDVCSGFMMLCGDVF